jgi:stage V sporulation protein G
MEITDVKVFPVSEDKLKAFVSIIFDDCFIISDIKIIDGNNGLFVSMPSKKRKNGTFRDIAHPLNNETRKMIEEKIFAVYHTILSSGNEEDSSREAASPDEPAHEVASEESVSEEPMLQDPTSPGASTTPEDLATGNENIP